MPTREAVILNQLGAGASAAIRAHAPELRIVEIGLFPSVDDVRDTGANVLLAFPQHELTPEQLASPVEWAAGVEWVHLPSAGIDPYPRALLQGRAVTCSRGVMSVPIAEHVFATMLAFERRIPEVWAPGATYADLEPLGLLEGKTLGILGLGSIGRAVATRALAFGMEVIASKRSDAPSALSSVSLMPVDDVLARADHLVLAVPDTVHTRHLLNDRTLALVRPGVHLVNVARGSVIDQEALLRALNDGRVARASLDVTEPENLAADHPLRLHASVRLSPHISWAGPGVLPRLIGRFLENLDRWRRGEELLEPVDTVNGY